MLEVPRVGPPPPRRTHVPQLDGLRGIAVAAILLFHLGAHAFRTGFLGVDVFFVISGFLITSLLLVEVERHGRISLGGFWARRIRRLLPALIVFLLVVAAVGDLRRHRLGACRAPRGSALDDRATWPTGTSSATSNYFVDTGIDSPLEHTWSLAIEEQFYLVWPLVIAGMLVWLHARRRTLVLVTIVAATISAALLFARWDGASVERAYMGTDARVFEPMIGALGAIAGVTTLWARRHVPRHARWLAPLAAALVALGLGTISAEGSGYFTWGALALLLVTVVLIATVWIGVGIPVPWAAAWPGHRWSGSGRSPTGSTCGIGPSTCGSVRASPRPLRCDVPWPSWSRSRSQRRPTIWWSDRYAEAELAGRAASSSDGSPALATSCSRCRSPWASSRARPSRRPPFRQSRIRHW